jgi:hypothetical protein
MKKENIIKARKPRVRVGDGFSDHDDGKRDLKDLYIPIVLDNGDYTLPVRHASITNLKVGGKSLRFMKHKQGKYLPSDYVTAISARMATDLGLSLKDSKLLLSRPIRQIKRVEELVAGIFDSLLLANPDFFLKEDKISLRLLRKILIVSTYNADDCGKMWKDFCSFVSTKSLKTITIEEPKLRHDSIFKGLIKHKFVEQVLEGVETKVQCTFVAHLTSSRQLITASAGTAKKSLEKFKSTVTEVRDVDPEYLLRIRKTSAMIARKILRIDPTSHLGECHISLSAAGDFETSVHNGGRAQRILEDIRSILDFAPPEDEEITLLDNTTLVTPKGIHRWKCWYREPGFLETERANGTWGDESQLYMKTLRVNDAIINEGDRLIGLDEALGPQILACAMIYAEINGFVSGTEIKKPIPTRTIIVPEPGIKARSVSSTVWWNIILQQSVGNLLKAYLKSHPSASAGLVRADQAWLYLVQLSNTYNRCDDKNKKLLAEFPCLSSDLEEATDSLIHIVSRNLLEGFLIDGLGFKAYLVELAINLICSPRDVFMTFPDKTEDRFISTQGAPMGEPMTKGLLVLHSLVSEEMAIRDYLNNPHGPIREQWRCFAVGGDDHIAKGPLEYLRYITKHQVDMGSKISKSKHGISHTAVKYCEKVLVFKDKNHGLTANEVNQSTVNYENSVFVDSIKVRLLSPVTKSFEITNDRNTAIGKGKGLGRTLRWLNTEYFPLKYVLMVRDRFIQRMNHFLPTKDKSLFYQLLLPQEFGGLDLYLEGELPGVILWSPLPTQQLISKILDNIDSSEYRCQLIQLKSFTSNDVVRGTTIKKALTDKVIKEVVGLADYSVSELKNELFEGVPVGLRELFSTAKSKGFYTTEQFIELQLRGISFKEMLKNDPSTQAYNTTPWKIRYQSLWDEIIDKDYVFPTDYEEKVRSLKDPSRLVSARFVNINERIRRTHRDANGDFIMIDKAIGDMVFQIPLITEPTVREIAEEGLPSLRVGINSAIPEESTIHVVTTEEAVILKRITEEIFGDQNDKESELSSHELSSDDNDNVLELQSRKRTKSNRYNLRSKKPRTD